MFEGVESIQIIRATMTREEFRGFCLGNVLKYRLRAGKKDDPMQDLNKAGYYNQLWEKYKDA